MDLERETKKAAKAQVKKSSKRNSTANGETASTAPVIEITGIFLPVTVSRTF